MRAPVVVILLLVLSPFSTALAGESAPATPQKSKGFLEEAESIEQSLVLEMQEIEKALAKVVPLKEKLDESAKVVREADREWQESTGMLTRIVAQDRLRQTRQSHHQLSRQMKEERFGLVRSVEKAAREMERLEQELQEQKAQIESAGATKNASRRTERLNELQRRQEEMRSQLEEKLERVAPLLRPEWEPGLDEPADRPGPPFSPDGKSPWGSPERFRGDWPPPEGRQSPRGWLFLQRQQERMQEMENRINMLQQQIERLEKRLEQLENSAERKSVAP